MRPRIPIPMARLPRTAVLLSLVLALWGCAAGEDPARKGRAWKQKTVSKPQAEFHTWATSKEIRLKWQPLSVARTYTLFWSEDPDVAENRDNEIPGLKRTSYAHKGLENGKTYYYHLVGVDARGNERKAYPVVGDVPFHYKVRRYRKFLAVIPRVHDTFTSLATQYLKDPRKGWIIKEFNSLSTVIPFRAVLIPLKTYEPGSLTYRGYRTVPILTYHRLSRIKASRMVVLATDFELQMAYLKRNRFQVISLKQFVQFTKFKGQVPEKAVVITIDDGWRSTYEIALPILKRYGYPATLFLYTDLVGTTKQSLSWAQVKKLDKSGVIDVQCHTKSHRSLLMEPEEGIKGYFKTLRAELEGSRNLIRKKIGKKCQFLAYPYGATNHLVAALAEKIGYQAAFTVKRGANPFFVSNYRVMRSMIYGRFDLNEFSKNLSTYNDKVMR